VNCPDALPLIDPYLDGELDTVHALEVEQHLAGCAECAARREALQRLRDSIARADLRVAAPPELRERLLAAAAADMATASAPKPVVNRPARWTPPAWTGLAAAMVLAALLAWTLIAGRRAGETPLAHELVVAHVRSLMVEHLTDVASSDQHTVKPWFKGKVDFSPDVRDLSAEGFTLVGGRLDYLDNQPAAVLVYQRRKHLINLFIWRGSKGPAAPEALPARQGFHLLRWSDAQMNYCLISDLNAAELQELCGLLRGGVAH
jgi:anti-sigma factor RsiW